MKDGGNVRGLNTAATLWCSVPVGVYAGAGEMLDAVFVTALFITINPVSRPVRGTSRRSLARLDRRVLYRLRIFCDTDHQTDAGYEVTRAIGSHAFVLRELRTEKVEDRESSVVQPVWNRVRTTAR
jgi:putative Mg2+ transporter-C (MgtC) family protein